MDWVTQKGENKMEIVSLEGSFIKLVKNGRTILRTHPMNTGLWAVIQFNHATGQADNKKLPEDAAKELFRVKALALILDDTL